MPLYQRETLKEKWRLNLTHITSSKPFQDVWCQLNLTKYRIMPMEKRHFHELLNIMSYQFSSAGGTMLRVVTQLTTLESYNIYKPVLLHTMETGLNFVIVDEQDVVCALSFMFDALDSPPESVQSNLKSLQDAIVLKSPLYQKYMTNLGRFHVGEFITDGHSVVRPEKNGLKLGQICTELCTVLAIATGYKMMEVAVSHPMSFETLGKIKMQPCVEADVIDFSDITLTNGKHIGHFYDKLEKDRGPKFVEKIKKESIQGFIFTHFDQIKLQSNDLYERALEEWEKRAKIFFKVKSNI